MIEHPEAHHCNESLPGPDQDFQKEILQSLYSGLIRLELCVNFKVEYCAIFVNAPGRLSHD